MLNAVVRHVTGDVPPFSLPRRRYIVQLDGKPVMGALKVFISYAHEDEAHREALGKHLRALEREELIRICHDRKIAGGREWAGVIDQELHTADIVLLLISADFLDSDYCDDVEVNESLRLHDNGKARVLPVILRSCDWEHSRFGRLNVLPKDGRPIFEDVYPDQRLSEVARGLRAVVAEMTAPGPTESAHAVDKPVETSPATVAAPPAARMITIEKVSLFGVVDIGPLKLPWPRWGGFASLARVLGVSLLIAIGGAGLAYVAVLRAPVSEAKDNMRIARYDLALKALSRLPKWASGWPTAIDIRRDAELGARFQIDAPDWESLGHTLRAQRKASPGDPDLEVLGAAYALHGDPNYDEAVRLASEALKLDPMNAEAAYILGTVSSLKLDYGTAIPFYRTAVDLSPDTPQYKSDLARAFLETGQIEKAVETYRAVVRFPLARIEEALAHWAKGEMHLAADAQRDAIEMLEDKAMQADFNNMRSWDFAPPGLNAGIRLSKAQDKRCYAALAKAASQRLAGDPDVVFPPADCGEPREEIRDLLANDLCRFIDSPQPQFAQPAAALRRSMGRSENCPRFAPSAPSVRVA